MATTEVSILESLGITDGATQQDIINGTSKLLILDASAHLDWDWLLPFPVLVTGGNSGRALGYFSAGYGNGPVVEIFGDAAQYIASTGYHYSICEVGFLRGFADADPSNFGTLLQEAVANGNLRIAGGGITSPDNLITHGEAFIRNYLVAHSWLAANFAGMPAPVTVWIPDDFGHDPDLPIVVQAMGFQAAGFARVPGNGAGPKVTVSGGPSMATQLKSGPIDFFWQADDGSTIVAHYLVGGYGQGISVASNADIVTYLQLNEPASPTPYIYVPVLNDFSLPNSNLLQVVQNWNADPTAPYTNVIVANGSFEDYAQLVGFHTASWTPAPFNPNPYYTGCYGSRPVLKIRHQRATRNLLAAEAYSVIAAWAQPDGGSASGSTGSSEDQLLFDAWNLLSPSTHHDFITGTAIPDVFHSEQTNLLREADATARWLKRDAMQTIAGAVNVPPNAGYVVIFNPLGFAREGLVRLPKAQLLELQSIPSGGAFQQAADGSLLFVTSAPSLGYTTKRLGTITEPANPVTVTSSDGACTLSNGLLSATVTTDGIISLVDAGTGDNILASTDVANALMFYADGGDEYQFGMESNDWQETTLTPSNASMEVLESGPVRGIVRTRVTYDSIEYIRDYILVANEPMLRMRSEGAAPMLPAGAYRGCSVVVQFPLPFPIDTLVRGTPYHWTAQMPEVYWNDQTFLATHNFVIPQAQGVSLAAIYHADVPAWGISYQWNGTSFDTNNGVLYGCLWRNGDGHYFNWVSDTPTPLDKLGTDPQRHVREYAIRVPSTLGTPESGGPLQEALAFDAPLQALTAVPWTQSLPETVSLASSSNAAAIISAAKMGTVDPSQLVLRIYQPTNAQLATTITVASEIAVNDAVVVTALEQPFTGDGVTVSAGSGTVTVTMNNALATIAVS